jgi:type IV secretory pathway component VirB8
MVNKTKKELYEENKKLKNTLKTYTNFWETDAIEELTKQHKICKIILYIFSFIFIVISAFLIGLGW